MIRNEGRVRLVHCSDIHLLSLRGSNPLQFLNKRITGAANLAFKRGKQHDGALFERIMARGRELGADRLVVTGDLTNLALASEFEHVREQLERAGMPVTVIPGNHDAYTRGSHRKGLFEKYLAAFMEGERAAASYPFVQRLDGVALVGVSTAVPTLPMHATGLVGPEQLARLEALLKTLADEGLVRVVLIHHPVVAGVSKKRHDLLDLDAFGEVIGRAGAELVLHGHEHRDYELALPGPEGLEVPVHGISSGTAVWNHDGRRGAFAVYDVEPGVLERTVHTWDGSDFVEGGPR